MAAGGPQNPRTYISYARQDSEFALRLARDLRAAGADIWFDALDVLPGKQWDRAVEEAISRSGQFLVILSRASVESQNLADELSFALEEGKLILPILAEECRLPLRIRRLQSVDFTANYQRGLEVLLGALGVERPGLTPIQREAEQRPQTHTSADEREALGTRDQRRIKEEQRSLEQRAADLFQQNLRAEVVIERLKLEDTPFYSDVAWVLKPRINVLLGRNGYGKTYLLRSLVALLQHDDNVAMDTLAPGAGTVMLTRDGGEPHTIRFSQEFFNEEESVGKLPLLAIPDARFLNRSTTTLRPNTDEGESDGGNLANSGALAFLRQGTFESTIQAFLYGLCLDYFEADRSFSGPLFELVRDVVRELTDTSFDFKEVRRESRDSFTLLVATEGNENHPLPIQKASQGTLTVIAMFGLIYEFLQSLKQEQVQDVTQRSGIVLIDEVDAHLHPVWQQRIVGLLRRRFPRVQFLITAHSPMVVAGCLEDEVSVLRKDSNGAFTLEQFPNDFVGWPPEEIYRRAFEVEQPDEMFVRYQALRPFRDEFKRTAEDLEARPSLTNEEARVLQEARENLLYIDKAEERRADRLAQEELQRENKLLKERLVGFERAHETAAEAEHRFQELTFQSRELERQMHTRLRRTYFLIVVLAVACFGLMLALWTRSPR